MQDAQDRMLEAFNEFAERHGDADVVVVSHGMALKGLLTFALGVPLIAQRRFRIDLASLTVVERRVGEGGGEPSWSVVTLNEQCHLPQEAAE